MKNLLYTAFALGIIIALSAQSCSGSSSETDRFSDAEALLADEKGADLNFYNLFKNEKDMEQKIQYAEIFISKIDENSSNPVVAQICDTLAYYYEKEKYLFSKSIEYTQKALSIYSRNGMKAEEAECEYRLAKSHYSRREYDKALLCTDKALKLFRELDNEPRILDCYNLLGMVYQLCKDFDLAKTFFAKYVDGVRRLNDSSRFIYALNNAAVLENTLGDSVKTRKLIEESLKISAALKDTGTLCRVCLNSAGICLNLGLMSDARKYLDKSYMLLKGDIEYTASYYLYNGVFYYFSGNYPEAVQNIRKAVSYYSEGEFENKLQECWLRLQILYEIQGNVDSAYTCAKRYNDLNYRIDKDRVFLELFKAQNQIILSKEHEEMTRHQIRNAIIFFSILLVAIVSLLVTVMVYRKKKNQILLQQARYKSEKKLYEIKDMQKYQMDKMVEGITQELESITAMSRETAVKNNLKEIISNLKSSHKDEEWKELSNYIPDAESEFLKRLVKDFPELSINERRLCVLLNKNLSTKEISNITRQSPKSINVARTRLRNKLGLTGSDVSIQDFLSKFN